MGSFLQDDRVSQSGESDNFPVLEDSDFDENTFLTIQDVQYNKPQFYDAFVSYNDDETGHVMEQVVSKLEGGPYFFRLLVPDRDINAGVSRQAGEAYLIEKRCRKLLVCLSDGYLSRDGCAFHVRFARCTSPASKSKKIIPVIMHPCNDIPRILKDLTTIDLTGSLPLEWQWRKLASSIRNPVIRNVRDTFDSLPFETRV